MKQKGGVIKRSSWTILVLFSILGLMVLIGCGNGGGGGGGGGGGAAPTSFNTTTLFPLTSNWQTDYWTLFVDTNDHDFNGVMTRVMADTRGPRLSYWTNDQNGLLLHGFMWGDGFKEVFSEPMYVAHPICRIGDIHTGTFTARLVEINYYIECVGVEDVTVPAGTFANCMKIRLMIWPDGAQQTDFGYETLWLADNVGFVRAEADDNNLSELFVDAGDTRQLLSYHITDVDGLSDDEKALREYGSRFQEYYMAEDLNGMMSLLSPALKFKCMSKAQLNAYFDDLFQNYSDILPLWSTEDIQFNGDEATTFREALTTRVDSTGAREWEWNRETRNFRKENGEWKWYGDHLDFKWDYPAVRLRNTMDGGEPRVYNPMEAAFIDCSDDEFIDTPDVVASLTVTGPPGSGIDGVDLKPSWDPDNGWRGFWDTDSLQNPVSGFYTFRVEEPDGDYSMITDYLDATYRLAVPQNLDPFDGEGGVPTGSVTLTWDPVNHAHAYRVDMQSSTDDGNTWHTMEGHWPSDPQVTVNLAADTQYVWRVRARRFDVYWEVDSESRTDWAWFATYHVFNIFGHVHYRTYSDDSNEYKGWLGFTKNNQPIQASDITKIELKDSSNNPVPLGGTQFFSSSYFRGGWNSATSSVDFRGPESDSGFGIGFPVDTRLAAGTYTYEATTSGGDILTLDRYFPGETDSPVVDKNSMNYQWLGDGALYLTWTVPTGSYDRLRIDLYTQDDDDMLYVNLPPDKEELTIPAEWIQKMTDLKNPSSAKWVIVTRSIEGGGNNYARGYSDTVTIPWGGGGG